MTPDLSDIAATLARWSSRNGKWSAELVRNYAGAFLILEKKDGRSIGCMTRPAGFFENDTAAYLWARETVPACFDVAMNESMRLAGLY